MFIHDDLIFLQLQKTAGTHIAALLTEHLGGRMDGKHGAMDFDPGSRLVVGSVRNPWDWYVSLWSYGCSVSGGVQGLLTGSWMRTAQRIGGTALRRPSLWGGALHDLAAHVRRDPVFWRDVYADPHDPERFRRWLRMILSPQGRHLLGADYAARPLSEFSGFYTYRFLSIFTPAQTWRTHANTIRSIDDIGPFFDTYGAVKALIRNESLEEDLAGILARIGRPELTADVLRGKRINASKRGKAETYYDEATSTLVAKSDPFMVARFAYSPPGSVNA